MTRQLMATSARTVRWIPSLVAVGVVLLASDVRAGDGVVALQTADRSCRDESGDIYVDCGNGTVTDNRTGLVWLKKADCFPPLDWHQATEIVGGLGDIAASSPAEDDDCGLSDGSSPGEWRLPSADEWEEMVADAVALGCGVKITSDSGSGVAPCWSEACVAVGLCSFSGVKTDFPAFYWSTTTGTVPDQAWIVDLMPGIIGVTGKPMMFEVWPVRGGQ